MLADEFSRGQLDFAKLYPDRVFKTEIDTLTAGAGKLSDIEITMRLFRLVASANVGHNAFRLPSNQLGFDRLPILMRWYAEPSGYTLAIVAAAPSYSTAVGTRVIRIGSMTPAQLFTAITPTSRMKRRVHCGWTARHICRILVSCSISVRLRLMAGLSSHWQSPAVILSL